MVRALLVAMLLAVSLSAADVQEPVVLHIKIVLVDAEQKGTPVARHALLISANPTSAPPRRVVTALDGTADVRIAPGNYTVESDRPVSFQGKGYQWTQIVEVAAGRDATLELTIANAEIVSAAGATDAAVELEDDPSSLLTTWQNSIVALWTPTTHASGFMIDAKGLIATNQRVVGSVTSVEVQLTPAIKVAARVLVSDAKRDVAILWIDPKIVAAVRPVPLTCAPASRPTLAGGQEIFTIGVPLRRPKDMTSGTVSRVGDHAIESDLAPPDGSTGGPVFTAGGVVVGITSFAGERDENGRGGDATVVPVGDVCDAVASAEKNLKDPAPSGTLLPVEPERPFPVEALKAAAKNRAGSLSPYQVASSDFDIAFITPLMTYGAQYQTELARGRERGAASRTPQPEQPFVRPLMDFSNWSEYVAEIPPVLLVRVTPRFVESFWMKVARGAASTQGVSLPPIKRWKAGFSRMLAFCGDAEVTPIHPFKIERRVSESEAIYEGLYVFDPGALGPHCASVKLVLYSEKALEKGDTRIVEAKVLQQIWEDFAAYRQQ